eukprot:GHVR01149790.1.p1 GENE.GHVR01149790.1~~GHVR01149790.1.p1  ORF type:complete len:104 (+),score=2.51 GHVR01149790.1:27-338(+)
MIRKSMCRVSASKITIPKYITNPYLCNLDTKVVDVYQQEGHQYYQFQDTIFHLQGGGQPSDLGFVRCSSSDQEYPILGGLKGKNEFYYLIDSILLKLNDPIKM